MLSKNDKLIQSDYNNVAGAKELSALQSDKRWKIVLATIDAPEFLARRDGELAALKGAIRDALAAAWLPEAARLAERLTAGDVPGALLDDARKDSANPLHAWARLGKLDGQAFAKEWETVAREWREKRDAARAFKAYAGDEHAHERRGAPTAAGPPRRPAQRDP